MSRSQQQKNEALQAAAAMYDSESTATPLMQRRPYSREYENERYARYYDSDAETPAPIMHAVPVMPGQAMPPPRLAARPHGISRLLMLFACLVCVAFAAMVAITIFVLPLFDRVMPRDSTFSSVTVWNSQAPLPETQHARPVHRTNASRNNFISSLHQLRRRLDDLDAQVQVESEFA